jgi:addiction module HigA family antidote
MAEYPAVDRKRRPTHPGELVRLTLENLRVSTRSAALAMRLPPAGLASIMAETGAVTPEIAERLGVYFGNGSEIWLRLQADCDRWHARHG